VLTRRPGRGNWLPFTAIMVMTAHASVDDTVTALRSPADEFFVKPVTAAELAATVTELVERGRERAPAGGTVLAIGSHPDDVAAHGIRPVAGVFR